MTLYKETDCDDVPILQTLVGNQYSASRVSTPIVLDVILSRLCSWPVQSLKVQKCTDFDLYARF